MQLRKAELPVSRSGPAKQVQLRGLSACREEAFRFIRLRGTSGGKPGLCEKDGLRVNQSGTRLLGHNIKVVAEQLLSAGGKPTGAMWPLAQEQESNRSIE